MGTDIIQSTKIKRKRTEPFFRNKQRKSTDKKFRLTDLKFEYIYPNKNYINSFLPMLYKGLKLKYPEIEYLEVKESGEVIDVVQAIQVFLKEKFNLKEINFVEDDNGKRIFIYKEFNYREFTIWILTIKNVFKIKHSNPKLFKILLGFISELSFSISDKLEEAEESLNEHLSDVDDYGDETRLFGYETYLNLKKSSKNLDKMRRELENIKSIDWKEELNTYYPKKARQKNIKNILLKSFSIDFSMPYKFADVVLSDLYNENYPVKFIDLFGVYYDDDIFLNEYVLNNIEVNSGENGIVPPLDTLIIDKNGIVKDFDLKQNDFDNLTSFIEELAIEINNL